MSENSTGEMIRDYQAKSIDDIRNQFLLGHKKVLLWLATGSGKTFLFCRMVKEATDRGLKSIIVVRGRKLVDQASRRLTREGVEHGVLMANHWQFRPHLPVQVCSIDTMISRQLKPPADLIIVDEAHMSTSKGYKTFLSQYNAFVVSVTATPYVETGLKHVADTIVHTISMQELIDQDFLVPFRYFAPSEPDLSKVQVSSSTHDYVVDQLEGAMVAGQLTGKIVQHWLRLAHDLPTICFAVNVHHSKVLVEKFLEAGIAAEHTDAKTSDSDRNSIIRRLESGETKVICNVGILGTGVDIPCLRAIIMARPTKSKNLFIQQAGRGTRTFPGKENCILLDHSGNIIRHGLPTDEPEVDLNGKEKNTSIKLSKICKECFAVYRGPKCPECGIEAPPAPLIIPEESHDELQELRVQDPVLRAYLYIKSEGKKKGHDPRWAMHKLVSRYGIEIASKYLPDWFVKRFGKSVDDPFANSPFSGIRISNLKGT